jgi:hypothetical protein
VGVDSYGLASKADVGSVSRYSWGWLGFAVDFRMAAAGDF